MISFRIKGHPHVVTGRGYAAIVRSLMAALILHGVPFYTRDRNERVA